MGVLFDRGGYRKKKNDTQKKRNENESKKLHFDDRTHTKVYYY